MTIALPHCQVLEDFSDIQSTYSEQHADFRLIKYMGWQKSDLSQPSPLTKAGNSPMVLTSSNVNETVTIGRANGQLLERSYKNYMEIWGHRV